MEAQTSVEPLRSLGGKRAKKDGVAASRLQAVGKDGDHGRGDALAPSGLQCEQILNHAGAVRRNGVSAIGNGHTVPHREVEVKGAALGSIASDHACADFGRYVEVVGAPAFSMIGEDELEQRSPIGVAGDGRNSIAAPRSAKVALQRHLDRDGSLFEIIEREAGEKCVRREAVSVYYAPPGVTEMLIHCSEHGINFGIGLGCDIVGMVCVPYVWMRRISNDVTMGGRDLRIAKRRCHR